MTDAQTTAASAAEPEQAAAVDDAAPSARRRRAGAAVLSGVLALLAVAALVLAWQLRTVQGEQDAREDAMRYASQTAKNLTSISFEDVDNDLEQVLDGATGGFEDDFAQRSDNLREVLTTNEVVSEGEVLSVALSRFDEDSATALVVVDATVRNTETPEGGVNTYRMKLELEREGDQWLTSMLEFVG